MNFLFKEIRIILDFGYKRYINFYMILLKIFIIEMVIVYVFF